MTRMGADSRCASRYVPPATAATVTTVRIASSTSMRLATAVSGAS